MERLSAILLAAGRGLRLRGRISKPLIKINSKPVIIYSLEILSRHTCISDIIVVANKDNLGGIAGQIEKYRLGKVKRVVLGGALRQDSVWRGLQAVDSRADLVLIHDAARPFISKRQVVMLADEAGKSGAAILGVPVKATIKQCIVHSAKCIVKKTLDRERLWEVQTPQVFKKDLILEAYKRFRHIAVTDDSALVEKLGVKVSVVLGSYENIKITTPEDLAIAETIVNMLSTA